MDENEDAGQAQSSEEEPSQHAKKSHPKPRVLTAKMVDSREVDRERSLATESGQSNKPNRSLRTAQKFARLQNEPWKMELAVELTWYARSADKSTEQWSPTKFAGKLQDAGIELPDGLPIEAAIAQVLDEIESCDATWYQDNIVAPMDERFAQGQWVPDNLDDANRRIDAAAGLWARGRTYDSPELQSVRLVLDLQHAADVLDEKAGAFGKSAASEADASTQRRLRYQAKVCVGAALLARRISESSDGSVDIEGLGAILDSIYQDSLAAGEIRSPGTNSYLIDVAMDVDGTLAKSSRGGKFCSDIARMLKELALTVRDQDPKQAKEPNPLTAGS